MYYDIINMTIYYYDVNTLLPYDVIEANGQNEKKT